MISTIGRRKFITLLGAATSVWPLSAWAQQADRMRRVGVLRSFLGDGTRIAAFMQGMQTAGWTDGRNVRFDFRLSGPDLGGMLVAATEMVISAPDVIVTTNTLMTTLLSQQTRTIPIVLAGAGDA